MSKFKISFSAEKRDRAGKGVARALRRENRVPAVIYGDGKEPVSISLSAREVKIEFEKGHIFTSMTNLIIGNETHLVLARDVQLHPVTDQVEHIDFLRVTPKTKIAVQVPLHFVDEDKCPGMNNGKTGVLNVVMHEIELLCSATDIPDAVEVSLEGKDIGDAIHVGDVKLPAGAKLSGDATETIASIQAPRTMAGDTSEAAEGETAEA